MTGSAYASRRNLPQRSKMANSDFVLPKVVQPKKYRITLKPNLSDFTFEGRETVDVGVKEPTREIVLNAAELKIHKAEFSRSGRALAPAEIHMDKEKERVTFVFDEVLDPGEGELTIEFEGILNDKMHGFYRSQYEVGGEKRALATTQFEATDARRAFPCWDEPTLKARFELTLVIPADLTAISNMPVIRENQRADGLKEVSFAETPLMSTYILAFMVGEFESQEETTKNGTKVAVWATSGKREQGQFALKEACEILTYFEDYYAIPYPLPKMDLVAIPDFAAGAMENWGAITFREIALLVDEKRSSAATKQRVAEVVAHEIAHMWFGNLVTMEWWGDLWLNESFATFVGTKAVGHLHPEWDAWTQFVYADTNRGLSLDGLASSHPIEAEVKNPNEISQIFDAISYSKGGAVLRMLEAFLGEEDFRKGVRDYLEKHQYGNAQTSDLWEALEQASGKPVRQMMNRWVRQTGYPVISVKRKDGKKLLLNLSQKRFLYDPTLPKEKTLWPIPLGLIWKGSPQPVFILMEEAEIEHDIGTTPDQWVKANAFQTGFYRVNYDSQGWEKLGEAIKSQQLSTADRLGLCGDAFALMKTGEILAPQYLEILKAYKNEKNFPTWAVIITGLRELENLLAHETYYPQFEAFARDLLTRAVGHIGWKAKEHEGHLDALLRDAVLYAAGRYGDRDVLEEALAHFARFLEDEESLHPNLHRVVMSLTAKVGDEETHERLVELYRKAKTQEQKIRYLGALTHFHHHEALQKTLEFSLSPEVRNQDVFFGIAGVAANPRGRDLAWEFVKTHWTELDQRFGEGKWLLGRIVEETISKLTTLEKEQEVDEFFRKNPVPKISMVIAQSMERIKLNRISLEKNRKVLEKWFANHSG